MLRKKSLGQHFLRNSRILQKIVGAARLSQEDIALEVGPGEGALTELLLGRAKKVVAVEKDNRLIPILQQKFSGETASGKLRLICADILTFSPGAYGLTPNGYKIVANLPYYITGQFLRKFLQSGNQPSSMTLLLQKEVAKRIVAGDGRESILSISVKAYGTPRYTDSVKAGSFVPPPKVDSAILAIEDISVDFFRSLSAPPSPKTSFAKNLKEKEVGFFAFLKKGFAHPRKLLSSNLGIKKDALAQLGIRADARAENLSLADWKSLFSCERKN